MKVRNRRGIMRIVESLIAIGLIMLSYTFLLKSDSTVMKQNDTELKTMRDNLLNTLEDKNLLIKITNNEKDWNTQIHEIVRAIVPPNMYYNITFRSLITNKKLGESITNIDDVRKIANMNAATGKGIYSYSFPILKKQMILIDVIMVMDRSGSMSWKIPGDPQPKIFYTKIAAKNFIDRLNSTSDKAGLTSFSTTSTLDSGLTSNFDLVKNKINALNPNGWTNLMGGIDKANIEFQSNSRVSAVKVMIILTDGKANWWNGNTGGENEALASQYALEKADIAKGMGVKIFTIGLGASDYLNVPLLESIQTDGYFFAPSAQDLDSIYQSIADKIFSEIKYDVVQVEVTLLRPMEGIN